MCVDDLDACVAELEAAGHHPRPIVDTGMGRYSMVEGPDGVLLEVFEPPPGLDAGDAGLLRGGGRRQLTRDRALARGSTIATL